MKELLAITLSVVVPLVPAMIEVWITRNDPKEHEEYEHSYY